MKLKSLFLNTILVVVFCFLSTANFAQTIVDNNTDSSEEIDYEKEDTSILIVCHFPEIDIEKQEETNSQKDTSILIVCKLPVLEMNEPKEKFECSLPRFIMDDTAETNPLKGSSELSICEMPILVMNDPAVTNAPKIISCYFPIENTNSPVQNK